MKGFIKYVLSSMQTENEIILTIIYVYRERGKTRTHDACKKQAGICVNVSCVDSNCM